MSVLPIRVVPDPVLRRKSKRVRNTDSSIQKLIDNMLDTMRATSAVGVAAPQVGVSLRVIVIQIPGEEEIALVNPEIVKRRGERLVEEGCLSVPGYQGQTKRSASVTVKGLDRQGKEVRLKAEGLLAQALEHEIDHLSGILYLDRLANGTKLVKVEPQENAKRGM